MFDNDNQCKNHQKLNMSNFGLTWYNIHHLQVACVMELRNLLILVQINKLIVDLAKLDDINGFEEIWHKEELMICVVQNMCFGLGKKMIVLSFYWFWKDEYKVEGDNYLFEFRIKKQHFTFPIAFLNFNGSNRRVIKNWERKNAPFFLECPFQLFVIPVSQPLFLTKKSH